MIGLPPSVRIYVATAPVDLRKSFDGLSVVVESVLRRDPLCGHLFCFFNKRGNQIRILFWDRSGWCIVTARSGAPGDAPVTAVVSGHGEAAGDAV